MNNNANDRTFKEKILYPIIIGIVVAIIGGASAPWWLKLFQPDDEPLVVTTLPVPVSPDETIVNPPPEVDDLCKDELISIFNLGNNKRTIEWGPHWRDNLNGVKGHFEILPTNLRIIRGSELNEWHISQEFEISEGVTIDHLPSPNPNLIPHPPIASQTYTFSGIATVRGRIKIENSLVLFSETPSLSYTTGNLLGDGASKIIQYLHIKNGAVISSDNCVD
jgi:hypothetical protein